MQKIRKKQMLCRPNRAANHPPPQSPKGEAQAVRNPQIATTTQFLKAVDWRASHIRFFAGTVSPLKIYVLTVVF